MREPAKKDQQGEVKAGGLYVKELTVPKTPMKEDMCGCHLTKSKTRRHPMRF